MAKWELAWDSKRQREEQHRQSQAELERKASLYDTAVASEREACAEIEAAQQYHYPVTKTQKVLTFSVNGKIVRVYPEKLELPAGVTAEAALIELATQLGHWRDDK